MIKIVILFFVLVTIGKGKVILSKEDDISNFITIENTTKSEIQSKLPVFNITLLEKKSSDQNTSSESTPVNQSKNCGHAKKLNEIDDNAIIESDEFVHACDTPDSVDNGTALILTPFIENGKTSTARKASKVNPEVFLGYESYSGFLTVNKTYNSNTFFWYFPVQNRKVNETPWIIWLQGGPGVSSLIGLFDEMGPFKFDSDGTLKENPYTWLKNHSLLYIDNPIGAGYSFTDHLDGLVKDMDTYGKHLYEAVRQFLEIFPELKQAPLFVAGESYAGKYVPALAMEIHKNKDMPGSDIKLEGVMIGNAFIDPSEISNISYSYLYFGLLSREQIDIVNPLLMAFQQDIANNNSLAAKNKFTSLVTILLFLSHQKQAYNFLEDEMTFGRYTKHLRSTEIKRALHVGDIKYSFVNGTVHYAMAADFLSSSKTLFEELLNHYRVLAYCGQLDQMLPCVFTSEHYRTWKWNETKEFLEATRYPYIFNGKLAGYHKTGGRLTEVVIRGAGHMVPQDKPAPIQNLVARWTHSLPLSRRFGLLEGSYVQEFVSNKSLVYL